MMLFLSHNDRIGNRIVWDTVGDTEILHFIVVLALLKDS